MSSTADSYAAARLRRAQRALRKALAGVAGRDVTTVEVEYDGCGDSGMVESVVFMRAGESVAVPSDAAATVEEYVEALLEVHEAGWEQNEGSFGTAVIDLARREVRLEHNSRYTTYSQHEYKAAV